MGPAASKVVTSFSPFSTKHSLTPKVFLPLAPFLERACSSYRISIMHQDLCCRLWRKHNKRRIHPLHSKTFWSSCGNIVHTETTWEQKLDSCVTKCTAVLWELRTLCTMREGSLKKNWTYFVCWIKCKAWIGKDVGSGKTPEAGMTLGVEQEDNWSLAHWRLSSLSEEPSVGRPAHQAGQSVAFWAKWELLVALQ